MLDQLRLKFNGKKILIMGLGLHGGGLASVKFFHSLGARLTITDIKTKDKLSQPLKEIKNLGGIRFTLGKHSIRDFKNQDYIFKNPDVPLDSPYLIIARDKNIPVITDIGIFFSYFKGMMIGITGTKGKSTTSSLISQVLSSYKKDFRNIYLLGNIRKPIFEYLSKISDRDLAIIELSSFQLEAEDVIRSPQIAIITNIFKDHLNHHRTFKEYIKAKEKIFKYQNSDNWLIINNEDKILKNMAKKSKSRVFNANEKSFDKKIIKKLKALDNYNIYKNQLLNTLAVSKIFNIPPEKTVKVFKKLKPLEGRLETVAKIKGIRFINDTTATNPDAAIFALRNLGDKNKVILIAGGVNKNLDYIKMAKLIPEKTKALILLPGNASNEIEGKIVNSRLIKVNTMKEAVKEALKIAKKGDIVLLSPGASSFNMFKHEFDRGKEFVDNIKLLAH